MHDVMCSSFHGLHAVGSDVSLLGSCQRCIRHAVAPKRHTHKTKQAVGLSFDCSARSQTGRTRRVRDDNTGATLRSDQPSGAWPSAVGLTNGLKAKFKSQGAANIMFPCHRRRHVVERIVSIQQHSSHSTDNHVAGA
jgi:hypothetical protein